MTTTSVCNMINKNNNKDIVMRNRLEKYHGELRHSLRQFPNSTVPVEHVITRLEEIIQTTASWIMLNDAIATNCLLNGHTYVVYDPDNKEAVLEGKIVHEAVWLNGQFLNGCRPRAVLQIPKDFRG